MNALRQVHLNWLLKQGVSPSAVIDPTMIEVARGGRAWDGVFEHAEDGPEWLAFSEENDTVYWRPATGELATEWGNAFALGQDEIRNPGATALGSWLSIHASPLEWLQAGRRGIVVLRWEWAFDQLRDVARIAVSEELVETYLKAMVPPHMPEIGVIPRSKREAA